MLTFDIRPSSFPKRFELAGAQRTQQERTVAFFREVEGKGGAGG